MSCYPVILSLENHCSQEQQEILAHYLTSILGDKLLRVPVDLTAAGLLPSPNVGRAAGGLKGVAIFFFFAALKPFAVHLSERDRLSVVTKGLISLFLPTTPESLGSGGDRPY